MNLNALPGILQRCFDAILMGGVYLLGAMGLAAGKMDAEMAIEVIVFDGLGAMRHSIHGRGIDMAVVFYQDGSPFPAPMSVNAFHNRGIAFGGRLAVRVVGAGPAFDVENLAGLHVLYLEIGMMRNGVGMLEPVQGFGGVVAAPAAAGAGLLGAGAVHFADGFAVGHTVDRQAVGLLEGLHRRLGSVAVIPVHGARVVSQAFQLFLDGLHRGALVPGGTGISRTGGGRGAAAGGFGGATGAPAVQLFQGRAVHIPRLL